MRIFQTIRKVFVQAGGSSSGFIASVVQTGLALSNRFNLVATEQAPAVAVDASRNANRISQTPAVAVNLLGVTGSAAVAISPAVSVAASLRTVSPAAVSPAVTAQSSLLAATVHAQTPAVSVATSASGSASVTATPGLATSAVISAYAVPETPAFDMTQVTYGLVKRAGGNAQAAVGTAWTNPANAISGTDGLNDGVNATSVGSGLGNTNGIELNYPNSVNKSDLTITSVSVSFYLAVTDGLGLCTRTLSYNIGAGLVTLETGTGTVASPRTFTLPITTWAQFDALACRVVTAYAAASVSSNATLDAIVVTVNATRTDSL